MLEPTCQSVTHCPWIAVRRNPYKCQFFFLVHKRKQSFRHHRNGPWTFAVKHKTMHRLQQLNPDFYVQIRQENKSKHLGAAAVERIPPQQLNHHVMFSMPCYPSCYCTCPQPDQKLNSVAGCKEKHFGNRCTSCYY